MDFLNKKTNKQEVLNFVITLDESQRQKMLQNFLQIERQNMQNQAIFELYIPMI